MNALVSFDNGRAFLVLTPEHEEERGLLSVLKGFQAVGSGLSWNDQAETGEPVPPRMHPSQCKGLVVRFEEDHNVARRETV